LDDGLLGRNFLFTQNKMSYFLWLFILSLIAAAAWSINKYHFSKGKTESFEETSCEAKTSKDSCQSNDKCKWDEVKDQCAKK
jgi:hypothetical protein